MSRKPKFEDLKTARSPLFTVRLSRDVPLEEHMLDNISGMLNKEISYFMRLIVNEGYKAVAKSLGVDLTGVRDFRTPELLNQPILNPQSENMAKTDQKVVVAPKVDAMVQNSSSNFSLNVESSTTKQPLPSFLLSKSDYLQQTQKGAKLAEQDANDVDLNI